jgi:hypothetical protein
MKVSAKSGLVLIVGLGVGISVGIAYARRTVGLGLKLLSQQAAGGEYAQLAHLQYRYADASHARAALLDFINFAQQMKDTGKVVDSKTLNLDVAHAYMRLAGLDRRAGNMDGYQSNVSHAQEALGELGVRGTAVEDNMERFLKQDGPEGGWPGRQLKR